MGTDWSHLMQVSSLRTVVVAAFLLPMMGAASAHAQGNDFKHWFIAVQFGVGESRAGGLEEAMRAAGFDDRSPDSFLGPGHAHPQSSDVGLSTSFEIDYSIRKRGGVGLVYDIGFGGSTSGYRDAPLSDGYFLFVDHHVTAIAPTVHLRFGNLRGSAGPAWSNVRLTQSEAGGGLSETQSAWGFVALAGASVPATSRVFFDMQVHYHHVGTVTAGPYTSTAVVNRTTATLPATNLHLTDWSFAVGPGIRF